MFEAATTHPPLCPSCVLNRNPDILDDARLLPRMRSSAALDQHNLRRQQGAALLNAIDANPRGAVPSRSAPKSEAGDLRGIPVIGRGVGGASPGTSPMSAIGRVDRQRERDAKTRLSEPMIAIV